MFALSHASSAPFFASSALAASSLVPGTIGVWTAIAAAKAPFISRGDNSGTQIQELAIWKAAGIDPKGQAWYQEAGQGMGATLNIANEKRANQGCAADGSAEHDSEMRAGVKPKAAANEGPGCHN